jgi:hypothetical protein
MERQMKKLLLTLLLLSLGLTGCVYEPGHPYGWNREHGEEHGGGNR